MKAISIVFIILLFNIFMSFVSNASIFSNSTNYENLIIENMNSSIPRNINETRNEELSKVSSNVFSNLISMFSFSWILSYANALNMRTQFEPVVSYLNIICIFLIGIAFLEILWVKDRVI